MEIHDEAGEVLPPGQVGEIYARRGDAPDFEYHGHAEERRAIERRGLITNRDMGYLDEDGYLFLRDRKRDTIISGGVNIYPAEAEAVLVTHRRVRDCAVFGIPDPEYGESVAAAVELTDGPAVEPDRLAAHLAEHVARFKIPRTFTFHDSLPRLENGKVYKAVLRAPYWR